MQATFTNKHGNKIVCSLYDKYRKLDTVVYTMDSGTGPAALVLAGPDISSCSVTSQGVQ